MNPGGLAYLTRLFELYRKAGLPPGEALSRASRRARALAPALPKSPARARKLAEAHFELWRNKDERI